MGSKGIAGADHRAIGRWTEAKTARWEADYFCPGSRASARRWGKRMLAKALRRAARAQITEGLASA